MLLQLLFLLIVHGSSYFLHPIGLEQPPNEVLLENPHLQGVSVREGGRCGVRELGTGEAPEWVDRHLVGIFGFLIKDQLDGKLSEENLTEVAMSSKRRSLSVKRSMFDQS